MAEAAWVPSTGPGGKEGVRELKPGKLVPEHLEEVTRRIARRVRALTGEDDEEDPDDLLELLRAGSQRGLVALGERAGQPVRTLGGEVEPQPPEPRPARAPLSARVQGFDVHAGKAVAPVMVSAVEPSRSAGEAVPVRAARW